MEEGDHHQQRDDADRHVHQEHPAPAGEEQDLVRTGVSAKGKIAITLKELEDERAAVADMLK